MISKPHKTGKISPSNPVIFIFLDGVGIGSSDPLTNPIAELKTGIFPFGPEDCWDLPNGGIARKVDVQLDTPGLPQSATGQASLFTGINAAKIMDRHLPGFPTPKLKRLIGEKSIFRQIKDRSGSVVFANCYSPQFFESPPRWISVTTAMCISSGTRLFNLEDLYDGRSLFFDFTNQALRMRGLKLEPFSPEKAAKVLIRLTKEFDFCLYENFLSDLIGHRLGIKDALEHLLSVEEFLESLVSSQKQPIRSDL